jgi:hypothetical protein
MHQSSSGHHAPVLSPRDVIQVAFVLDHQSDVEIFEHTDTDTIANKRALGQLSIQWRGALGDRGSLSTGWLTSRR